MIGRRRQRIRIETRGTTTDSDGQPVESWTTLCNVWASVEPLTAKEQYRANQVQATTTHKIGIPYRSDVTEQCRAVLGSRVFNFDGVRDPDERGRELEIDATEVKSGA